MAQVLKDNGLAILVTILAVLIGILANTIMDMRGQIQANAVAVASLTSQVQAIDRLCCGGIDTGGLYHGSIGNRGSGNDRPRR